MQNIKNIYIHNKAIYATKINKDKIKQNDSVQPFHFTRVVVSNTVEDEHLRFRKKKTNKD